MRAVNTMHMHNMQNMQNMNNMYNMNNMNNMRNMQMNRNNTAVNRHHLMKKLRQYDFAITETVLFLDTHPNNRKALQHYSKLVNGRREVVAEYERNVGPITMYGNESDCKWDWITGPWPWEGDC